MPIAIKTAACDWSPPNGLDAELTEAGVHWDALHVPAYLGDRVLARLGEASGAVIRDPYAHRLYWLTSPAATASWRFRTSRRWKYSARRAG